MRKTHLAIKLQIIITEHNKKKKIYIYTYIYIHIVPCKYGKSWEKTFFEKLSIWKIKLSDICIRELLFTTQDNKNKKYTMYVCTCTYKSNNSKRNKRMKEMILKITFSFI